MMDTVLTVKTEPDMTDAVRLAREPRGRPTASRTATGPTDAAWAWITAVDTWTASVARVILPLHT